MGQQCQLEVVWSDYDKNAATWELSDRNLDFE
jgi:hypothetical protein